MTTSTMTIARINAAAFDIMTSWVPDWTPSHAQMIAQIDNYCDDPATTDTDRARILARTRLNLADPDA